MSKPLAKRGDLVVGIDTHIVLIPSPTGPIPTPLPNPFRGPLSNELSTTVFVDEEPAAIVGSEAVNTPPHIPAGGPFQTPPDNTATVQRGSVTVFADDEPVARLGDPAMSCNDPADAPTGRVVAAGTVIAD